MGTYNMYIMKCEINRKNIPQELSLYVLVFGVTHHYATLIILHFNWKPFSSSSTVPLFC